MHFAYGITIRQWHFVSLHREDRTRIRSAGFLRAKSRNNGEDMSDLRNKLLPPFFHSFPRLFFRFPRFLSNPHIYCGLSACAHNESARENPTLPCIYCVRPAKYFRFKCNFYKCHINLIKCPQREGAGYFFAMGKNSNVEKIKRGVVKLGAALNRSIFSVSSFRSVMNSFSISIRI